MAESVQSCRKKGAVMAKFANLERGKRENWRKRRKIKIVVDSGNRPRLYTPHKDGDALGDALLRFSRNAGCTPRDNRVCDLCLFEATLFEN
jgi:hypothetical protein